MELLSVCRCCLTQGLHKDVNTPYFWLDKKEIYSNMLQECFNIALSSTSCKLSGICDACIKILRSSLSFREQVLRSEDEFLKRIQDGGFDEKPIQVKLEPNIVSGDESDDYFLADTAREVTIKRIKCETKEISPKKKSEGKRSKVKNTAKKAKVEKWEAENIKTLVNRLATSINTCDKPDIKLIKKKASTKNTIILKSRNRPNQDLEFKSAKINLLWSRKHQEKFKHRENLETILKFSNAIPFTNKNLLGYICGYCQASYPDPKDLRQHTEAEHITERLTFKTQFDLQEYIVKLDVNDLTCTLCDEKMVNLSVLKEHLVKIHSKTIHYDVKDHILQFKLKKGDVYDCAMCTSTYETFKMLKQHMNIHYRNYSCTKCESSFATKRSLNAHLTTHQEGSFKCDHCEKVFSSRPKKHYHEKMKHLGARNISNCPYCDEPFRSYYQRNQHLVKVHNSEAQYKCNVCNKAYILKSLLMYHIKKSHLMERNCQCTECGYRFFSKKALKAHMIKHTGERIFACEVCHKSYARKYTLREHMRIHNNDRRFKCDVCAMTFVQKCSLKSHLLSNHGISMAASDITSI